MASRLYVDNYTQAVWSRPTRAPIIRYQFQRGSSEEIQVRFVTDGVAAAIPDTETGGLNSATVTLSFKATPDASTFLIPTVSAVSTGSGAAAYYKLVPVFTSTELDNLLGSDLSAVAYMELRWTSADTTNVAGPFLVRIFANLNRGGEISPGVVTSAFAVALPTITSFTGLDQNDLPYVPTAALDADTGVPYTIRLDGQTVFIYLDSGAADGADSGQAAPLDYDAETNDKHWTRGL